MDDNEKTVPLMTLNNGKIMNSEDENEPVEVFAGTTWHAGLLKSLLEDAEIEAFLVDEIMGTLNPWWTAPGGAGSVRVMVSVPDYEKAKAIVSEYEANMRKEE